MTEFNPAPLLEIHDPPAAYSDAKWHFTADKAVYQSSRMILLPCHPLSFGGGDLGIT